MYIKEQTNNVLVS